MPSGCVAKRASWLTSTKLSRPCPRRPIWPRVLQFWRWGFINIGGANGERGMSKLTPLPVVLPTNPEEVLALVKKAEMGDLSTLPTLRACMKIPEMVDLFGGDLARNAQATLIGKLCGKNLA